VAPDAQIDYEVETNGTPFSQDFLENELGYKIISENGNVYEQNGDYNEIPQSNIVLLNLTPGKVDIVKKQPNVKSVKMFLNTQPDPMEIFPYDKYHAWSVDSFGPLHIPKKGETVALAQEKFDIYRRITPVYEKNTTEVSKGKKTLIFNNGIHTSLYVLDTFKEAGYTIKHLDNTTSAEERKDILKWFKHTPDAILTSVGILTTGFDEPTVETIIINRATKSLTLYFQMIGRGSRLLPNKKEFTIIDLGNNAARFGLWYARVDWQHIFKSTEIYFENLR